jgi:hypothetical protein
MRCSINPKLTLRTEPLLPVATMAREAVKANDGRRSHGP